MQDVPAKASSSLELVKLLRRGLMLLEVVLGGLATAAGVGLGVLGVLTGHRDSHHGGTYVVLGGALLMVFGVLLLCTGLCLRSRRPVAWLSQLVPASVIAWTLWDVLGH